MNIFYAVTGLIMGVATVISGYFSLATYSSFAETMRPPGGGADNFIFTTSPIIGWATIGVGIALILLSGLSGYVLIRAKSP